MKKSILSAAQCANWSSKLARTCSRYFPHIAMKNFIKQVVVLPLDHVPAGYVVIEFQPSLALLILRSWHFIPLARDQSRKSRVKFSSLRSTLPSYAVDCDNTARHELRNVFPHPICHEWNKSKAKNDSGNNGFFGSSRTAGTFKKGLNVLTVGSHFGGRSSNFSHSTPAISAWQRWQIPFAGALLLAAFEIFIKDRPNAPHFWIKGQSPITFRTQKKNRPSLVEIPWSYKVRRSRATPSIRSWKGSESKSPSSSSL